MPVKTLLAVFIALSGLKLVAQDQHFSQFYNHPLHLSPALAGVFSGDQRFSGAWRSQWASVPVPYLTFSAAYDQKIPVPGLKNGSLAAGLLFNYDRAGDAGLNWLQAGLNVAFTQRLAEAFFLSAGVETALGQRAFDPQLLYFDEQFDGDIFDPSLPTQEAFLQTAAGFTDLSAGLNLLFQAPENRTFMMLGAAYRHINQPSVRFYQQSALQLRALTNIYLSGAVQTSEKTDATFALATRLQGPYLEIMTGAGIRYYLQQNEGRSIALGAGVSYRWGDALVSYVELWKDNWRLGFSYDINTSPFRVATQRNGGPELTLQYIIQKVKAPETFKICPIF
jgi:type IX secretion system PorP/SprF family membrane protein